MRSVRSFGLLASLLALSLACDRGFEFTPAGWTPIDDGWWSYHGEHFEIRLVPLVELDYARGFTPEVVVESRAAASLTFFAPVLLESSGVEYAGGFGGPPGQEIREIVLSAGESRRFPVFFSLSEPLRETIGPESRVSLRYRVDGGEVETFSFVLRRSR